MAEVYTRTCVEAWEITAKNGDHFAVIPGQDYTTSRDTEVRAPAKCFTAKRPLGAKQGNTVAGDLEYHSWSMKT